MKARAQKEKKSRPGWHISVYIPDDSRDVRLKLEQLAKDTRRSLNEVCLMILEKEGPKYAKDPALLLAKDAP